MAQAAHITLSFSGGRTSGYMLWLELQKYGGQLPEGYRVLFANTGRERDETLDFIHECETRWGVPVTWLEYTQSTIAELTEKWASFGLEKQWAKTKARAKQTAAKRGAELESWLYHDWKVVSYETAHRIGQPNGPFDKLNSWLKTLPNVRGRSCTAELKIRTMDRYLSTQGWGERTDLIGIRGDEAHRCIQIVASKPKRIEVAFPLVALQVTEADVLGFWKQAPFDLQLDTYEGNCDLCYLKSRAKILRLMRENPNSATWWIEQERLAKERIGDGNGNRFRADRPGYSALLAEAQVATLPGLDDDEIVCSCTEGGYRYLNQDADE